MSLTLKFLPPILGGALLVLLLGAYFIVDGVKSSTNENLELARASLVNEQNAANKSQLTALNSKADSLGLFMSKTAAELILAYDFTALKDYQGYAVRDADVAYAAYLKPDGSSMTDYTKPDSTADIIERKYEIKSDDEKLGYVLLGMSKSHLQKNINNSNARISNAVEEIESASNEQVNNFLKVMTFDVILVLTTITLIVYFLFKVLVLGRLKVTTNLINHLSEGNGDLTQRLPTPDHDEISNLCLSVNNFVEQLHGMVSNVVSDVNELTSESGQLNEYSSELTVNADNQRMETNQVASAMNQMAATVQEVANNANNAADAASNAHSEVIKGRDIVSDTIDSIKDLANDINGASDVVNELEKNSDSIGGVLEVIRGIAEQTNLLALNAAIEAARAGEQGRGFAVVADEVRTLASRTQESTNEIQTMIEQLQHGSSRAVSVMKKSSEHAQETVGKAAESGSSLEIIADAVTTINDMNTQIAKATVEQSTVAEEINRNVDTINNISDNTAGSANKTSQTSHTLSEIAMNLEKVSGQFRL